MAAAAPSPAPLDEAKSKSILRQVEFYFSDSNLPRDGFLRRTVEESDDGLVSLALICSFSRMRSHLGLEGGVKPETVPEETVFAVADVLRHSSVLRVSEDGKKVGRANELLRPDEVIEQVDSRTVAASPLPHSVKLEDVESFFAQYGKVNSVRLPRHVSDKRHFCGTALVEFSEEDEAKGVFKNKLVFAGANLEIKSKIIMAPGRLLEVEGHISETAKVKEFDAEREAKIKANEKSKNTSEGYPKGQVLAFKLKKISSDCDTVQNAGDKVDDTGSADKEGASSTTKKSIVGHDEKICENKKDLSEEKLDGDEELKGVAAGETAQSIDKDDKSLLDNEHDIILREDIKEEFTKFGTVRYVDFRKGEDSGYIRFEESKASEKARAFAALQDEGGFIMKGHIVTLEPVTGQAEKEYWSAIQGRQEKHKDSRCNKGRDWQSNRGGKQFGGKRGRNFDSHERTSNKAQKV